ncbi:hypothetical protein BRUCa_1685 [Brucella melitensis]|nr:hypothetical protein BM28_A1692 [Brucella melitensis M28]AEW17160.1 hypothetical protein BAA13334_I01281 [Brucella abortus A13334]
MLRPDPEKPGLLEILVFANGAACPRRFHLMIGKETRLICI